MLLAEVPPEAEEAVRCLVHEQPLTRLRGIRQAREHLEAAELHAVREAKEAGATWKRIGSAYGITPQSAYERFSPKI
jgi:hypothetical protein